jgi:osmoprotectant transport system permease protein
MFDGIVNALVNRLAPILVNIGEGVCARTPGLVGQWPTYEFMCRNTDRLAELTVEHIILTVVAMIIAVILGVLIGVRVSSAPWPQPGTLPYWPAIGLVAAFLVVGVVTVLAAPGEVAAVEGFKPPNLGTWGRLFAGEASLGLFGVLVLVQSVLILVLGAVFVTGVIPGGADLRVLGAALAGAFIAPLVIPRPILHFLLTQLYLLVRMLGVGSGLLGPLAGVLNFARDAAPVWALLGFLLVMGKLSKRLNWQSYLAAFLAGYAITAILSVFVTRPGAEPTPMVLQLVLFALFATLLLLGEKAADPALYVVGVIFTIPSLAMFGIMIPIIGIGVDPAIIALVLYGLLPILRNTITALHELDPAYSEAGRGMGMTDLQLLIKVQLPLALPVILAGVRVSTVMTVGIASIATLIGAGGLGELIFQGINRTQGRMVLTGAIWIALLALAFDFILGQGEIRWVSKGIRPDRGKRETPEPAGV